MPIPLPIIGALLLARGRLGYVIRSTVVQARRQAQAGDNWPFEQPGVDSAFSLLIAGDSTAVGTGAAHPGQTIAGYFGSDFPRMSIRNIGVNGMMVKSLALRLEGLGRQPYDAVMMIIGGNDVLQRTPMVRVEAHIRRSIHAAQRLTDRVMVVCQGNMGNTPIFPRWLSRWAEQRSRALRDIFRRVTSEERVSFVDFFTERRDDPWGRDAATYYAPDLFHPAGAGYRWWYEIILERFRQEKWLPPNLGRAVD